MLERKNSGRCHKHNPPSKRRPWTGRANEPPYDEILEKLSSKGKTKKYLVQGWLEESYWLADLIFHFNLCPHGPSLGMQIV